MAIKDTTTVSGTFKNIPEKISYEDFIANVGTAKFNEKLRDEYATTHYVELDLSRGTLGSAGWTKIEIDFLRKAFHALKGEFNSHENIKLTGDKLFITGGAYRGKGSFGSHGPIFKRLVTKASELLKDDYKQAKQYNPAQLSDAIADITANRLDQDDLKNATRLKNIAYSRLFGMATDVGKGLKAGMVNPKTKKPYTTAELKKFKLLYEIHGGHLEGHENYRLAAATRFALATVGSGIEYIPDSIRQKIDVLIGIDKETIDSIIKYVEGKVHANELIGTRIIQKTTMELAAQNVSKRDEQILANLLSEALADLFVQWSELRSTQEQTFKSGSSPSIIQQVEDFLITILTGGKGKTRRADKSPKKSTKKYPDLRFSLKTPFDIKKVLTKSKKIRLKRQIERIEDITSNPVNAIDLFSTHALINQILAINVEEQMADSGSTDGRLRYQTGRFADSAKLLTLTRAETGILAGSYTYQRNPYDVFLPGHKMATPKRNPKIYVEGAIREAAITILKERFPGIVLRL